MPDLKNSKTLNNLREAFKMESAAEQRYRYYMTIARFEGLTQIAQLFEDTAENDAILAAGHLDFIKNVGDPRSGLPVGESRDNLNAAMAADQADADEKYPDMASIAREEGFADIADWFENLAKAKAHHADRFQALKEKLSSR